MTALPRPHGGPSPSVPSRLPRGKVDLLTGAVTVATMLIFIGTGSRATTSFVDLATGHGKGADATLATAVLLNIALMLFGWGRYRDLAREVGIRAAAEDRARTLATHDPLTGLLNRRSLGEGVATLFGRAALRGKTVAMLTLDIDNFKTVNDLHGHEAGDALLRAVAAAVAGLLPPNALLARLGGDEFACVFLYDATNPAIVDLIAGRLIERLAMPFDLGEAKGHVTASLGIARSDHDCTNGDALMRRADIAMHIAKKAGRNRSIWFDAGMERALQARNAVEAGLRGGIPAGEFVPYYEQQIDLATGRLLGFEVLARWDHPTRGLIPPDMFIPVAEEIGVIGDLSLSVMRQAFEEARGWDAGLTLSVNISPAQLKDPWLAQKIVKLLTETGYPARRLEIEITESALFDDLALARTIIGSLKNQGIRLALDDFGTGYSSLAHLRALPFDRIKIDRSFVMSMVESSESAAIVTAIARLGDSLGMPTTAEGIEDAVIAERLQAIGCHKGQGFHYGRPMPIRQVRTLLAEQALLPCGRAEPAAVTDPQVAMRRAG